MIWIYSLNSSGSNWILRLFKRALGDDAALAEPFSPNAWDGFSGHPDYLKVVEAHSHLRGRWQGRNETITGEMKDSLQTIFDAAMEMWPKAQCFKTLDYPYWEFVREYYDDVKFVRMHRDLEGFLCCIARRPHRTRWYDNAFYYDVGETTPWWETKERFCREKSTPPGERNLVNAAFFYLYREQWLDENEPDDVYVADFKTLAANWCEEPHKIMDYCGLPRLNEAVLADWASIVPRSWSQSPFDVRDVARISEDVVEWVECQLPENSV